MLRAGDYLNVAAVGMWEIPVSDLAHVRAEVEPGHLVRFREEWDDTLYQPIVLDRIAPDRYRLRDGNHRLTLAREWAVYSVEAVVLVGHVYLTELEAALEARIEAGG